MAQNDTGFSASDVHAQLPRLPDVILGEAHQIAARNAEMYREPPPPHLSALKSVSTTLPHQAEVLEGQRQLPKVPRDLRIKVQESGGR